MYVDDYAGDGRLVWRCVPSALRSGCVGLAGYALCGGCYGCAGCCRLWGLPGLTMKCERRNPSETGRGDSWSRRHAMYQRARSSWDRTRMCCRPQILIPASPSLRLSVSPYPSPCSKVRPGDLIGRSFRYAGMSKCVCVCVQRRSEASKTSKSKVVVVKRRCNTIEKINKKDGAGTGSGRAAAQETRRAADGATIRLWTEEHVPGIQSCVRPGFLRVEIRAMCWRRGGGIGRGIGRGDNGLMPSGEVVSE
jgi:hypothetical protein